MRLKLIICFCLIAHIKCVINRFPIKLKTIRFNQHKTPFIIYDSESNKVISNIIAKPNNKSHNNGNETFVLINLTTRPPVYPGFQNLCKMNFIDVL